MLGPDGKEQEFLVSIDLVRLRAMRLFDIPYVLKLQLNDPRSMRDFVSDAEEYINDLSGSQHYKWYASHMQDEMHI